MAVRQGILQVALVHLVIFEAGFLFPTLPLIDFLALPALLSLVAESAVPILPSALASLLHQHQVLGILDGAVLVVLLLQVSNHISVVAAFLVVKREYFKKVALGVIGIVNTIGHVSDAQLHFDQKC